MRMITNLNNNTDIKQDLLFNRQNMAGLMARSLSNWIYLIKLNVAFQALSTIA